MFQLCLTPQSVILDPRKHGNNYPALKSRVFQMITDFSLKQPVLWVSALGRVNWVGGLHPYIRKGTEYWSTKGRGHSTLGLYLPVLCILQTEIIIFLYLMRAAGLSRQPWRHIPQQGLLYLPSMSSLREGACSCSPLHSQYLAYHKCNNSNYHSLNTVTCTVCFVNMIFLH